MERKIGDLLGRFAKIIQDGDDAREAVLVAVKNAGIRITETKQVTIRNGIVTLKLSPAQKSEVALKQKKILEELAKHPLTKNIRVVR